MKVLSLFVVCSNFTFLLMTARNRLRKDYIQLKSHPLPYIYAEPLPSNILEWHYLIRGPEATLFSGGIYHGKLVFPSEFPFRPPAVIMLTPNGRFKTNERICLSISDFHPDSWNPIWTVGSIIQGVLSFMLEDTPTLGAIVTSESEREKFAEASLEFNIKNSLLMDLFPQIYQEMQDAVALRQLQKDMVEFGGISSDPQPQSARSRDSAEN